MKSGERRMAHLEIVFVTDHPIIGNLSMKDAQRMISEQFAVENVRGRYYAKVVRTPHIRMLPGCPHCTSATCPTLGDRKQTAEDDHYRKEQ